MYEDAHASGVTDAPHFTEPALSRLVWRGRFNSQSCLTYSHLERQRRMAPQQPIPSHRLHQTHASDVAGAGVYDALPLVLSRR